MLWTPLATASAALSSAGSALLVVKLARDWDVRLSSVRWLFLLFFASVWLYTTGRVAQYAWLLSLSDAQLASVYAAGVSPAQLDRLGIFASVDIAAVRTPWVSTVACFCDAMHFAAALWVLPLTFELAHIASKTMDRGVAMEQRQIRLYTVGGLALIAGFVATQVALAAVHGGYCDATYKLALAVYALQVVTLVYMVALLFVLRCKGRDVEAVHGHFEASPIYRRLVRIMLVYALFAFQYELLTLSLHWTLPTDPRLLTVVALSQVVYNATGFMLAAITGCSLPCVLRFCGCCLPDDLESQLVLGRDALPVSLSPVGVPDCLPPFDRPVFVVTDIEASSALWGVGDGLVMQRATEIHDNVLRQELARYRGYEITTAGDSFQLAFHTVREAVEYCLAVQTTLLAADWPKELHGLVPATQTVRSLARPLFRGLRVRMGVHAAADCEGPVIVAPHAVTGKMTYAGVSFEIANEVGNLGAGGQVLVTERVAQWIDSNNWLLDVPARVERLGSYTIPQANLRVELFQILPHQLRKRARLFPAIDVESDDASETTLPVSASGDDPIQIENWRI